ncbi:hypothetical protein [Streptomyces flaveolus]|uniref:hypothetical protein n=1 Tax=Streptomyces flaveolus TaxID=67297 RepID=UPI0036ABED7A
MKPKGKLTSSALVAGLAAALSIVPMTGTAAAVGSVAAATGSFCIYQGDDRACAVNHTNGYSTLEVCDNETDGNGVYAYFYTGFGITTVQDGNGSAAGCGSTGRNTHASKIELCEKGLIRPTCVTRSIP